MSGTDVGPTIESGEDGAMTEKMGEGEFPLSESIKIEGRDRVQV